LRITKAGIRFGLNGVIKDKLRDPQGNLTPAKNFVAGLGAGVSEALIVVAPVETIKTKCIELNMAFVPCFRHILATEGLRGVYQGATATALKQGSNQGYVVRGASIPRAPSSKLSPWLAFPDACFSLLGCALCGSTSSSGSSRRTATGP
jgi:Mitochondrial carrier protein